MFDNNLYRADQVRELDRLAIAAGTPGIALMRSAGDAAFAHIMSRHAATKRMVVVCGAGNNGGDGYVVAACARRIGVTVTVLAVGEPGTDDAITAARDYRDVGGEVVVVGNGDGNRSAGNDGNGNRNGDDGNTGNGDGNDGNNILATADLIVDAIFGTGLSRAPAGVAADCIRAMNAADAPVVSLDVPSGLHSDSGCAFSPCVAAQSTLTFIAQKLGLHTGDGRKYAGEIVLADLNIADEIRRKVAPAARIITAPKLSKRAVDAHKGDAGRVLIIGGDAGMLGAVLLAGEAALRCGSGLVTVASTTAHLDLPALHRAELMSADAQQLTPEFIAGCDAMVLGPGLGRGEWGAQVYARAVAGGVPTVLDADALFWLAQAPARNHDWILTPHPGEAARLLGCDSAEIQADRPAAAQKIADKFGGICVLKGAGTLVADGTAEHELMLCDKGNPGMASAGMGDVLSGVIGALLAQGLPAFEAAVAGVWLHGYAANEAVKTTGVRGLLAGDVIQNLATVIASCES